MPNSAPNLGQPVAPGIALGPAAAQAAIPLTPVTPQPGISLGAGNQSPPPPAAPAQDPYFSQYAPNIAQTLTDLYQNGQATKQTVQQQPEKEPGKVGLFGSALASLVASAKATGPLIAATWDVLNGNTADEQVRKENAAKDLTAPVLGYKPLNAMNNEEALGTGAEAAAVGAGFVTGGAATGAIFGGANALENDGSARQVIEGAGLGAAGGQVLDMAAPYIGKYAGAIGGKAMDLIPEGVKSTLGALADKIVPDAFTSGTLKDLVNKYAPSVSKLFTSSASAEQGASDALSNFTAGLGKASNLRNTLGQEMADLSGALTEQFPDATINLNTKQVQAIQQAAQKAAISLPDFMDVAGTATIGKDDVTAELGSKLPGLDLTIEQAQQLGTSLNQAYEKGYVESVYGDLRDTVRTQLNDSHAGLGTVYDQMYETASKGYTALETLDDIFNSKNRSPNASDISNSIGKIQKLSSDPQSQKILQTVLQNFKDTTGVDLTTEANAIDAAGKIKSPLLKRAALAVAKQLPYVGSAIAIGHDVFGK
jgi:hypothetical protein